MFYLIYSLFVRVTTTFDVDSGGSSPDIRLAVDTRGFKTFRQEEAKSFLKLDWVLELPTLEDRGCLEYGYGEQFLPLTPYLSLAYIGHIYQDFHAIPLEVLV